MWYWVLFFVSLQTQNIVGHGACSIDCLPNGISVLYVGFATTAQATELFVPLVRMMITFCQTHRRGAAAGGGQSEVENQMTLWRGIRDQMQRHVYDMGHLQRATKNLGKCHRTLLQNMNKILKKNVQRIGGK
jgi:hypothetical protein